MQYRWCGKGIRGKSAYVFCIRNKTRDLIYAHAGELGIAMNIEVEAREIKEAFRFSAMNSLKNMVIETDSLNLKNIIQQTQIEH